MLLTPGQAADINGGRYLLAHTPPPGCLIADKAYDADDLRGYLAQQGTCAVISPRSSRRIPPPFNKDLYRHRNRIERAFCKLKDWRAIATRYDKLARNFLAGIALAAALTFWIS